MPGGIDELMRFSYQTPPLEQVSDYDKYYMMDPLRVNGAQDTITYGGMVSYLFIFVIIVIIQRLQTFRLWPMLYIVSVLKEQLKHATCGLRGSNVAGEL
jgi:hypothetical protein